MLYFADKLTIPLLRETGKRKILEIGSSYGNSIKPILEMQDTEVSIIDPCFDSDLLAVFGDRVTLYRGLSLDVLPHIEDSFDCIFIDGDHNWFTVFNELKAIEHYKLLKADGVIILHDIGWPYGRRDMYYQPEAIPAAFRNRNAKNGIQKGRSLLLPIGGFNAGHYNAIIEGGPRNGVLTAVEDYIEQSNNEYYFVKDFREFGLGILLKRSEANTWGRAQRLRLRILKQVHCDPYRQALQRGIQALKVSPLASRIRKSRDNLFRRHGTVVADTNERCRDD